MRVSSFLIGLALAAPLLGQTVTARAADEAGADRLRQTLAIYFGKDAIDRRIIAVLPDRDTYRVTLDARRLADAFGYPADSFQMESWTFVTAPLSDGTWSVKSDMLPQISYTMPTPNGDMHQEMRFAGYRFDGVFDPKIAAFTHSTNTVDSIDSTGRDSRSDIEAHFKAMAVDTAAVPAGSGVDFKVHETIASLTETVRGTMPGPNGGPAVPLTMSFNFGPVAADLGASAVRNQELLALWAFLVANPGKEKLAAVQNELKAKVNAVLPLWNGMSGNVVAQDVRLHVEQGDFGVKSVTETFSLSGAALDGKAALGIKFSGLTMPGGLVPSWGTPLIPDLVDLNIALDGVDFSKLAHLVIDQADLSQDPPWPPQTRDQIMAMLMAGKPKVSFNNTHIVSPDYDITVNGDVFLTMPQPTTKLTIAARDFDKTVSVLQSAAQQVPQIQQVMPVAIMAKGLAKTGADGAATWVVDYDGSGAVTINGQRFGPPGK